MLKRLQRNFMVLTMTLVAIVLFGTLAISYTATQTQLDNFVVVSLDRVLDTTTPTRPYIGVLTAASGSDDESNFGHMAVYWIDIDHETGTTAFNDSAAIIGPRALSAVMNAASSTEEDLGYIPAYDIVWKRGEVPGATRIAVANTTGVGTALSYQLSTNIALGCVTLVLLGVAMLFISRWMIQPVREAWSLQRQFTADASHELKTPLAVILANNQIMRSAEKRIPEEYHRWIESTGYEAKRMQNLVMSLLELSRADEGRTQQGIYRQDDLDLSAIVEVMTIQFDVVAFEHGLMIEEHIEPDIHVVGDRDALEKVVKIFLDNAVKYSTQGKPVDVTVKRVRKGRYARVAVRNWGDVLSPEDISHIFDRFYRSDKARGRETGGFGLGLAIAKAMVENNKGTIACASSAEDGTCFSFELPVA